MFKGHYINSINGKGRLSIPSKYREIINEWNSDHLIITKAFETCLIVFAPDDWKKLENKAVGLSMIKKADMMFKRHVVGSAEECQIDAQGRILIPASLREYACLNKKCLFVGITNRFEIWDLETYESYTKRMTQEFEESEALQENLAELGL